MSFARLAWLGLGLAACVEPGTALRLSVESELPLSTLQLSLQTAVGEDPVVYSLPPDGSAPTLPGVVVLRLADTDADIAVLLSGSTPDGQTLMAQGGVHCAAREVCTLALTLALPRSPIGAACGDASRCASGFCVDGVCCNEACDGGCNTCAAATGASRDGTCTARAADVVCRKAGGACDVVDHCDGASGACPDAVLHAGTVCRAAVSGCDVPEVCDGMSGVCPTNVSTCSTDAYCTTTGSCAPTKPNGAGCSDPTMCASGFCAPGGICCDSACAGPCEQCGVVDSKLGGACASGGNATVVCRPSTGPCDPVELCDGVTRACPADQKKTFVSTLVDLDDAGTGSINSKDKVLSSFVVGCPGVPTNDTVSRIFLTFKSLVLPMGSMLTSVQLHGCVTAGTADVGADTTSFPLPLVKDAYNAIVTSATLMQSSNGTVHDEVSMLPLDALTSGVETQLELRAIAENCSNLQMGQRVYATASTPQCSSSVFQLIVSRCQ